MKNEKVIEAVRAAAVDNRISCSKARALAQKHGVSLAEMGRICNELKIKVSACELGCF
ncbi:MAG TPA: hypothetical protein VK654_10525 [Nitrospirota bacterium]|nr:hypothetical protein [Nitrospirota bacterium]